MFKKNVKISPHLDESRQISVEECLRLKEDTRNRLKSKTHKHPRELSLDEIVSSYEESSRPLYAKMSKPPVCPVTDSPKKLDKRKKSPCRNPPSTLLSLPRGMDGTKTTSIPVEVQPKKSQEVANNLAKRQQDWLNSISDKSNTEVETTMVIDVKPEAFQVANVDTANSWSRAKQLSVRKAERDKNRLRNRQEAHRLREERRLVKTEQQLLELCKFDPAVYAPLKRVQHKLESLRSGGCEVAVCGPEDHDDVLPCRPHTAGASGGGRSAVGRGVGDHNGRCSVPSLHECRRSCSPQPDRPPPLSASGVPKQQQDEPSQQENDDIEDTIPDRGINVHCTERSTTRSHVAFGGGQGRGDGRAVGLFLSEDEMITTQWKRNIGDSNARAESSFSVPIRVANKAMIESANSDNALDVACSGSDENGEGRKAQPEGTLDETNKEGGGRGDFEEEIALFMRREIPCRVVEEDDFESDIPVPLLDQDGNLISSEYRDRVMVSPLSDIGESDGVIRHGDKSSSPHEGDSDSDRISPTGSSLTPSTTAYMSVQALPRVDVVKFLTRQNVTMLSRAATIDTSQYANRTYGRHKFQRTATDGGYMQSIEEGGGGGGSPRSIHTNDDDDDLFDDDDSMD